MLHFWLSWFGRIKDYFKKELHAHTQSMFDQEVKEAESAPQTGMCKHTKQFFLELKF